MAHFEWERREHYRRTQFQQGQSWPSSPCDANSSLQMTPAWAQSRDMAALAVRAAGSLSPPWKPPPSERPFLRGAPTHKLLRLQQWSSRTSDSSSQRPLSQCIVWSRLRGLREYVYVWVCILPWWALLKMCLHVCDCPSLCSSGCVHVCVHLKSTADRLVLTKDQLPGLSPIETA